MKPFPFEQQVQEYVVQLADETDAFRKSASFKEYLDTVAKFWRYSYRNQLLIHAQFRSASRVAGFRAWNELGRKVKKGSKAIKILAPFTKKVSVKDTEEEKELTYFFPVNVFDVSQTTGKELPLIDVNVSGNGHKEALNKLLSFCEFKGISVEHKELGANGFYGCSTGGRIILDAKQGANMQVNTLIHEIAHELAHYSSEGRKFSKSEREVQAEAVAYVVTTVLGVENRSAEYLAVYISDKNKILENFKVISCVAKQILSYLQEAS